MGLWDNVGLIWYLALTFYNSNSSLKIQTSKNLTLLFVHKTQPYISVFNFISVKMNQTQILRSEIQTQPSLPSPREEKKEKKKKKKKQQSEEERKKKEKREETKSKNPT